MSVTSLVNWPNHPSNHMEWFFQRPNNSPIVLLSNHTSSKPGGNIKNQRCEEKVVLLVQYTRKHSTAVKQNLSSYKMMLIDTSLLSRMLLLTIVMWKINKQNKFQPSPYWKTVLINGYLRTTKHLLVLQSLDQTPNPPPPLFTMFFAFWVIPVDAHAKSKLGGKGGFFFTNWGSNI